MKPTPTPAPLPQRMAELLLASDDQSARAYVSLALPYGAVLMIPKSGRVRRAALAIYNPLTAAGLAAKGLIWSGVWSARAVGVSAEALDELQSIMADLLDERHAEFAFWVGATGIYSKTVILVMDAAGRPLAYAKLAALATAQHALCHEISILERLSTVSALRGRIPQLLSRTEWRGLPVALTSPGPARRAPPVFGAPHREFLSSLRDATRMPGILVESSMWRNATALLAQWRSVLSSAWLDRYDWALTYLERHRGHAWLDLSLAQHDFVPWNTRIHRNTSLFVFDWEFSKDGSVPGSDFFHFPIALWAVRRRAVDRDAVVGLIAAARREGIEAPGDMLLAYLVDLALFYHDAMFCEGKQHHSCLQIAAQAIDVLRKLRS
jgi:hypothetical protein